VAGLFSGRLHLRLLFGDRLPAHLAVCSLKLPELVVETDNLSEFGGNWPIRGSPALVQLPARQLGEGEQQPAESRALGCTPKSSRYRDRPRSYDVPGYATIPQVPRGWQNLPNFSKFPLTAVAPCGRSEGVCGFWGKRGGGWFRRTPRPVFGSASIRLAVVPGR
jgi:hypothetical protein